MMNDAFDLRLAETHIEVHKFRSARSSQRRFFR